jgi:prepilin peptidase CpaA
MMFGLPAAGFLTRFGVGTEAGWWGSFAAGPVLLVLVVCTITDLHRHRIYNWATYSAFLWAIAAAIVVSSTNDQQSESSVVGFGDAIGGSILCFILMMFAYSLSGRRGAGDVKLAAALGAWLGIRMGLSTIIHTYAVAGVGVVSWLMIMAGPIRVLGYLLQTTGSLLLPKLVPPPKPESLPQVRLVVPMAPFFLIGTILAVSRVFG